MIICVSSSEALPSAIERKFLNPLTEERAAPSAIFEGIETADLRICDVRLYNYSPGNLFVSLYTLVTIAMALDQTFKSLAFSYYPLLLITLQRPLSTDYCSLITIHSLLLSNSQSPAHPSPFSGNNLSLPAEYLLSAHSH